MSKFERMSKEGSSKSEYANLGREKLAASLTCPLCNELFSHPTAITSCHHTFCKQCIHSKIINEQCRHCPICNIDIGVNPLTKLRSENSLNELRKAVLGPFGVPRVPTAVMMPTQGSSKSGRKRVLSSQGPITPLNEPSEIAGNFPVGSYSPTDHAANNSAQPEKCVGLQSASSKPENAPEPSKGSLVTTGSIEGSSLSKTSIPLKTREAAKKLLDFDLNELPPPSPSSSPVGLPVLTRPSTSERPRQQRRRRLVPEKNTGLPADDVLPACTDTPSIQPTQASIARTVVIALERPDPPTRTVRARKYKSLPGRST